MSWGNYTVFWLFWRVLLLCKTSYLVIHSRIVISFYWINGSAVGSTEVADLTQAVTSTWFSLKNELPHAGGVKQPLTAITLLVAESKPSEKDRMIGLVLSMLGVSAR